jgi:hypothetical protein
MDKVALIHPEGKKGISMEREKYNELRKSFLLAVQSKPGSSFDDLLHAVEKDLDKRKVNIKGSLQWNLFWVTLDLESKKQVKRDKSHSPYTYTV